MSRVFSNQKYMNGETSRSKTLKAFLWNKYHMRMSQFRTLSDAVKESYKKEFSRDYQLVYGSEGGK